jgi:aryl sulfotransferase
MVKLLRAPTREFRTAIMDSHRWDEFVPRSDDIVIATYSKCGTTWTQRIVDLLIFQTPDPRPVVSTAPWLDATFFAPIEDDLAKLKAQTHRRFIKTHMPFDSVPLYEGVKYIHVGRDGRDARMSMHNHMLGFRPEMLQRMAEVARAVPGLPQRGGPPSRDPRQFFVDWLKDAEADVTEGFGIDLPFFEFENTYWRERQRENVLFVHYNDLKADLAGEMRRIAVFLSIRVPDDVMPELVEAATFQSMKRDGDALVPMAKMAWDRGADRFINQGTNNRWKDVLSADDLARYDALAKRKWSKSTEAWVRQGRLIAGDPRNLPD